MLSNCRLSLATFLIQLLVLRLGMHLSNCSFPNIDCNTSTLLIGVSIPYQCSFFVRFKICILYCMELIRMIFYVWYYEDRDFFGPKTAVTHNEWFEASEYWKIKKKWYSGLLTPLLANNSSVPVFVFTLPCFSLTRLTVPFYFLYWLNLPISWSLIYLYCKLPNVPVSILLPASLLVPVCQATSSLSP